MNFINLIQPIRQKHTALAHQVIKACKYSPPVSRSNEDEALVEYAAAGMDNKLFVSQYLVQLPGKEQLQQFVENELRQL